MDLKEFGSKLRKASQKRVTKISNSWGVYDAYKHIRKNKWYNIGKHVTEHDFYSIIRGVNDILASKLVLGETIKFPHNMGNLEIRKTKRGVSIVDGKLKNTYPINWYETIRLWYEDKEERDKKTLIRNENQDVYCVKYNKYIANYENKVFYDFAVNRDIKKELKKNINNRQVNTLW